MKTLRHLVRYLTRWAWNEWFERETLYVRQLEKTIERQTETMANWKADDEEDMKKLRRSNKAIQKMLRRMKGRAIKPYPLP